MGRVPGDYPVPAGYCTTRLPGITRTRPGITLKCVSIRILEICVNFCDCQLYFTQSNAKWAFVLRPSLMLDTVASASRVTDNCPLGASRGRADGNLPRDGIVSHLTWRITMYVSTNGRRTIRTPSAEGCGNLGGANNVLVVTITNGDVCTLTQVQ